MNRLKIGVRLESLGLPLRRALFEAGQLGVAGVQVDAAGDLSPNRLSETGRREFRHLLRSPQPGTDRPRLSAAPRPRRGARTSSRASSTSAR